MNRILHQVFNVEKWDNLSLNTKNIINYANKNINPEPQKYKNNKLSDEYIIVSSGETINGRLRDGDYTDYQKYLDIFEQYKINQDITVYRSVNLYVYEKMVLHAKSMEGIDFFEKGVLHTSLLKGYEIVGDNPKYKLRIRVPKGTHAFYAGNINDEETTYYEVVIKNNTGLRIISIDDNYTNCIIVT